MGAEVLIYSIAVLAAAIALPGYVFILSRAVARGKYAALKETLQNLTTTGENDDGKER